MKKFCFLILSSFAVSVQVTAQVSPEQIQELKHQLEKAKTDSARVTLNFNLAFGYRFSNIDSSLYYSDRTIELTDKLNLPALKAQILGLKGATVLEAGKLPESLRFQFEAMEISEKINDQSNIAFALNRIGNIYMELGDYKKANEYYFRSKALFEKIGDTGMVHNEVSNIGNVYTLMQMPDSGLYYLQIVYDAALKTDNRNSYTRPEMMFRMGNAYRLKGDQEKAMYYYQQGIKEALFDNDIRNLTMNNLFLAKLFAEKKMPDSSIKYAYQAIQNGSAISFRKGVYDASLLLSGVFHSKNQHDSAYKYLNLANMEKDSLTGTKRFQDLQRIILAEQERERDAEVQRIADRNRQKQIMLLSGLALIVIIATILFRNNRQKQKANQVLANTLKDLKSTQSQLIQSEKMASLGELTAGIAHEIQNPLNFVNNFSEVNKELIEELKTIRRKAEGERNTLAEEELINDIGKNEEKIIHHGKRADAIVKGMLQHSRSSNGQKEPTDIHALCEEYLRLAYHGLRAKDKSFNATLKTDFDESIGKINIIPQDIGRVLLNLINNAFYACTERSAQSKAGSQEPGALSNDDKDRNGVTEREELTANSQQLTAFPYAPIVSLSTKKTGNIIEIRVTDNGNGIPQKILDKIFQPFFTTKPTGQGTGLGLSLSYDIVKAHGGELKVETKEGDGTTFIVSLPLA